jgi:hypothetical protein
MKKYAIIEVDEVIHLKKGETLNQDNLPSYDAEQTPTNDSLSDDLANLFDTIDDAREIFKTFKSNGRVDKHNKTYSVNVISYQLTEVNVEDGTIIDWGDVWDITPFTVEIDSDGNVNENWG